LTRPTPQALTDLIATIAQLRHPTEGCPWDLAQTPQSLIPYILEEAYETVDALRQGQPEAIVEELGDLLLQVILQAQIAQESGQFDLGAIAAGLNAKLIRRHPHVFGEVQVSDAAEVVRNWDQIKAAEKQAEAEKTGNTLGPISQKLDRDARILPPLQSAMAISQRAAKVGFEWPDVSGVWDKFHEELGEFQEALQSEDKAHQQSELGDLLFTIVNLARWYDLDPIAALWGTNRRFVDRFSQVEQLAGKPLTDYSLDELEAFWRTAKQRLGQ
jgi:XTP/dITP diphosphohydrolase